ncbi:NAD-dependent epimerase/dehydratase family protein [Bradyrhizobium sp. 62]|uniref:NAD-dependent epimerase/dehydratase family protein n=1 Tax=Bradyrhizobium sp. 62 TaxID=1043588 RepID=UPI001FFA28DA|nr:NAD-dependent epimerase/dehydratase family protein [Bradyrhizobium sp. 62]MCK1364130.1 GDP-mannose 4,6-dehydratase [Bradyrhizobium sp. 62]
MTARILVTGGAGFIGSHLVDQLVEQGRPVTVLDDFSVGHESNLVEANGNGDVRIVRGSVTDREAVANAFQDCEVVYHLATQCVRRSLTRPMESHDVNATGTITLLEEARLRSIRRFVYCSSSEVYGNASRAELREDVTVCCPMTAYGASKLAGELYTEAYMRTYGLPTTVVRPFNAYGPRAYQTGVRAEVLPRFVGRVLNGLRPVVFGDGTNARDFTYVTEIARGIRLAGEASAVVGQRVNIARGIPVTLNDLAREVLTALSRNDLTIEYRGDRPGDVAYLHADTGKAKSLLGYSAEIGLHTGVRDYIDWVLATVNSKDLLEEKIENWVIDSDADVIRS